MLIELEFENGVKNIQTAGYNVARTVCDYNIKLKKQLVKTKQSENLA